jgi:hypothetical protein
MNALVMATALVGGLSPTDSGERRGGADVREVCVDFSGEWEGTAYMGDDFTFSMKLGNGYAVLTRKNGGVWPWCFPCSVHADDHRNVSLDFGVAAVWPEPKLGIYELESGRLRLCYNDEPGKRPTSFRPGPGKVLWVLRRVEPKK